MLVHRPESDKIKQQAEKEQYEAGFWKEAYSGIKKNEGNYLNSIINSKNEYAKNKHLPHAETGGYVSETGQAVVHRGESIVPSNTLKLQTEKLQIISDNSVTLINETITSRNTLSALMMTGNSTNVLIKNELTSINETLTKIFNDIIESKKFSALHDDENYVDGRKRPFSSLRKYNIRNKFDDLVGGLKGQRGSRGRTPIGLLNSTRSILSDSKLGFMAGAGYGVYKNGYSAQSLLGGGLQGALNAQLLGNYIDPRTGYLSTGLYAGLTTLGTDKKLADTLKTSMIRKSVGNLAVGALDPNRGSLSTGFDALIANKYGAGMGWKDSLKTAAAATLTKYGTNKFLNETDAGKTITKSLGFTKGEDSYDSAYDADGNYLGPYNPNNNNGFGQRKKSKQSSGLINGSVIGMIAGVAAGGSLTKSAMIGAGISKISAAISSDAENATPLLLSAVIATIIASKDDLKNTLYKVNGMTNNETSMIDGLVNQFNEYVSLAKNQVTDFKNDFSKPNNENIQVENPPSNLLLNGAQQFSEGGLVSSIKDLFGMSDPPVANIQQLPATQNIEPPIDNTIVTDDETITRNVLHDQIKYLANQTEKSNKQLHTKLVSQQTKSINTVLLTGFNNMVESISLSEDQKKERQKKFEDGLEVYNKTLFDNIKGEQGTGFTASKKHYDEYAKQTGQTARNITNAWGAWGNIENAGSKIKKWGKSVFSDQVEEPKEPEENKFTSGGQVKGTTKTGDKINAQLNAGEWVFNENQMRNLTQKVKTLTGQPNIEEKDVFKMSGGKADISKTNNKFADGGQVEEPKEPDLIKVASGFLDQGGRAKFLQNIGLINDKLIIGKDGAYLRRNHLTKQQIEAINKNNALGDKASVDVVNKILNEMTTDKNETDNTVKKPTARYVPPKNYELRSTRESDKYNRPITAVDIAVDKKYNKENYELRKIEEKQIEKINDPSSVLKPVKIEKAPEQYSVKLNDYEEMEERSHFFNWFQNKPASEKERIFKNGLKVEEQENEAGFFSSLYDNFSHGQDISNVYRKYKKEGRLKELHDNLGYVSPFRKTSAKIEKSYTEILTEKMNKADDRKKEDQLNYDKMKKDAVKRVNQKKNSQKSSEKQSADISNLLLLNDILDADLDTGEDIIKQDFDSADNKLKNTEAETQRLNDENTSNKKFEDNLDKLVKSLSTSRINNTQDKKQENTDISQTVINNNNSSNIAHSVYGSNSMLNDNSTLVKMFNNILQGAI